MADRATFYYDNLFIRFLSNSAWPAQLCFLESAHAHQKEDVFYVAASPHFSLTRKPRVCHVVAPKGIQGNDAGTCFYYQPKKNIL